MKFKNKLLMGGLVAATIGLAAPATSFAQAARDTGWYVGGSIGQSKMKDVCNGIPSCDDKDTAWRILGGYRINRNFAAEIGYHDFGKATAPGFEPAKANAWELVGVGGLPVANQFSVYGKLGLYRGEVKGGGEKETNNDLTFGVGVQYDFSRNLAVRGEWQRYKDVGGGAFIEFDIDVFSVGALWKF